MFVVCKFPEEYDDNFVLFDSQEIKPEEFNINKEKEITFEELESEYKRLPIISLNDYLLRSLSKTRTISHKLGELNLDSYEQLKYENDLIVNKKSKLSKSQRDLVQKRYNEIITNV